MKVTKHKDGTLTLSGVTRSDLSRIALAIGSDALTSEMFANHKDRRFVGTWEGADEWYTKEAEHLRKLEQALEACKRSKWDRGCQYLPEGRSLLITSDGPVGANRETYLIENPEVLKTAPEDD